MVVGVDSFEVTEADGVELLHKVRYLSPLVVEKNLELHIQIFFIDYCKLLTQSSSSQQLMAEVAVVLRNWIVHIKCIADV